MLLRLFSNFVMGVISFLNKQSQFGSEPPEFRAILGALQPTATAFTISQRESKTTRAVEEKSGYLSLFLSLHKKTGSGNVIALVVSRTEKRGVPCTRKYEEYEMNRRRLFPQMAGSSVAVEPACLARESRSARPQTYSESDAGDAGAKDHQRENYHDLSAGGKTMLSSKWKRASPVFTELSAVRLPRGARQL